MGFSVDTLKTAFENVFASMTDGNDDTFPNGITNAVVTFVCTGQVTTTDGGAVTGGAYVGSGSGSLVVTPTACAQIIKQACLTMKTMTSGGADFLADEIGRGLQKMADDGQVTTTVTGTLTPPSSSPITPYGGTATGNIQCNGTTVATALKTLFNKMWNDRNNEGYDGNADFADGLAKAVNTFWTTGIVSTKGAGNIAGSTGTGTIA